MPLTLPSQLCSERKRADCVSPQDVEHWLSRSDLEILDVVATPRGKQGAKVLTVSVPDASGRFVFRVKWRAHTTGHSLNVPLREVAAYAVQKLFLEPHDYVVPPSTAHCFPMREYRRQVDARAVPPFEGIECAFGVVSYWLEDATDLGEMLDEDLFWQSRSYRRSIANVNLMSFLIDHGDSHPAQFLAGGSERDPRVFLVDNTIAFSSFRNPVLPPDWDWSRLQVPALPADSVARLAALRPIDFVRLHVIEQYENRAGQLVRSRRRGVPLSSESGLRWQRGELQIGLNDSEIWRLRSRAEEVVGPARRGEIRTF